MRATLIILFVGLLAATASASPAFVRYARGYDYPVSTLQITINGVGAGNLLVVACRLGTTGDSTVTSAGQTWTRDAEIDNGSGVTHNLSIHSTIAATGGDKTITITATGGNTSMRALVCEYSGITTGSRVVDTAAAIGYSGSPNSGNVTTDEDNCLLFSTAATDSDLQGWGAGSGYTIRNTPNQELEPDQKIAVEDKVVNTGTYAGNFSINTDTWDCCTVAYAPAAGGGEAPSITDQPGDTSKTVGEDATFTVTASGTPTLTYQWKAGGSNIGGATTSSYTKSSVQLADDGTQYTVGVTNDYGGVLSSAATLTVTEQEPQPPTPATFRAISGRANKHVRR